jgi:hypothetical protein
VMGQVASHPSAILLFVQLLGVLVYPYMETGGTQSVVFEIFGALVLALAIWATRESPGPTWIAVTLAVKPWMRPPRRCTRSSTSGPQPA